VISVTILTKDSARYLHTVLQSVRSFAEVVVLDSGSSDETLSIARRFPNVKVFTTQFKGFGLLHNEASALAQHDWILSLDSDEVMTEGLAREIAALRLEEGCVYAFPRRNYYNGKVIRGCGWSPDRQLRLYHRKRTRFTEAQVHEGVIVTGLRKVALSEPVDHYSYHGVADFLTKMQRYSELFAKEHQGKMRSSLGIAIGHSLAAFLKSYVVKRGIACGQEGFIISVYNANMAFYKYLRLHEANQRPP
jgi:glycosyltransferase involved in cell wall biosynthesis